MSTTEAPSYIFKMSYVDKDPTGYYHVRWDRAITAEIVASNRDAAFAALWPSLGESPSGRVWTAKVLSFRDFRIPPES